MKTDEKLSTRHKAKSWSNQQSRFWIRFLAVLVGWLLRYWVRYYRAIDADKVPREGGVFLICNHTTGMDPFLLGYPIVERQPAGPGKIELFENPVAGYLMRAIGMFPLRQGVADAAAVRAMIQLYRRDHLVMVYPEGGRSPTRELMPFVPEFARLMIRLRARIVPAAIAGGGDLLPMGSYLPRPGKAVVVVYGDELDLSNFYDRPMTPELAQEAAQVMFDAVAALLARARSERRQLFGQG